MLLSQAILLGSVETRQAYGEFRTLSGATCAWGSAFTARGVRFDSALGVGMEKDPLNLPEDWRWVYESYPPPTSDYTDHRIWGHICYLNDKMKWTRPQIAAWVAEQERQRGIGTGEIDACEEVACSYQGDHE